MNKNGVIITIKNNKGGVGKTFLTAQLGAGLSLLKKRVLILTSDSQNNIFNFLLKGNKKFKNGLKSEIASGNGEYFRLIENLYFLPLETEVFGNNFLLKLPLFLNKLRKEYDYILIDSTPVLKMDNIFLQSTDYIVVPAYCDEVTIEGIIKLMNEIDSKKILSVIVNRYKETEVQKEYLNQLQNIFKNYDIVFPDPIKQLSFIEKMLNNKKHIWEYNNKNAEEVKNILLEIIIKLEKTKEVNNG